MTVSEDGAVIKQATRADERVTRFGALLRRYSSTNCRNSSTCSRGA